jgi:hypothetical protein
LSFNSLISWTVGDGTVDHIRSGGFGINCVGGSTGGCLGMDGSTSNAGRIIGRQLFMFDSGVQYFIDLALSGNRRGGAVDSVIFGLIRETDRLLVAGFAGPIASGAAPTSPGGRLEAPWRESLDVASPRPACVANASNVGGYGSGIA